MNVLIACEYSGIVRDAFAARGHNAWSCDLLPSETPGQHSRGDVRPLLDLGWDLMIAFPPCTYLCKAGAVWMHGSRARRHERMRARDHAIAFFMELAHAPIPKIAIENPVGIMAHRWRPSDQRIQPYMFGDDAQKTTCLWLKNLPPLVPTKIVDVTYVTLGNGRRVCKWEYDNLKLPTPLRGRERSRTFKGIAQAMADQWG
jgi:hypothetical protein